MNNILAVASIVIKELYRRKDFYVLFVLTVLICLVMASVNFFNDDKIVRYLKEICLLLIWISSLVIAITTTARQIPAERENRTFFPLLAKPLTRTELVLGKFFGCWLACGLALVCFYLFFGLLAASREQHWPLINYFQAAVAALGHAGGGGGADPARLAGFHRAFLQHDDLFRGGAVILLLGRQLNKVALHLPEPRRSILYAVYYCIPHLELFDVRDLIIHDWPPIAWTVCGLATLYALAYAAAFLIAACLVFRRKAIN